MSIKDVRQKLKAFKEAQSRKKEVEGRKTYTAKYDVTIRDVSINPYDHITPVAEGTVQGVKWWASLQVPEVGWVVTVGDSAPDKLCKEYAREVAAYLNTHHPPKPKGGETKHQKEETPVAETPRSSNAKTKTLKTRKEIYNGKNVRSNKGKGNVKAGRKAR